LYDLSDLRPLGRGRVNKAHDLSPVCFQPSGRFFHRFAARSGEFDFDIAFFQLAMTVEVSLRTPTSNNSPALRWGSFHSPQPVRAEAFEGIMFFFMNYLF
jgi:hypothetical protein